MHRKYYPRRPVHTGQIVWSVYQDIRNRDKLTVVPMKVIGDADYYNFSTTRPRGKRIHYLLDFWVEHLNQKKLNCNTCLDRNWGVIKSLYPNRLAEIGHGTDLGGEIFLTKREAEMSMYEWRY